MSTPTVRKGRRRLVGVLATFAATVGLFLTFGASTALASVSCSYDSVTGVMTINVSDDNIPVGNTYGIRRSGEGILVLRDTDGDGSVSDETGSFCFDGGISATVLNVNTIQIVTDIADSASSDDTFVIDLSNGGFSPGFNGVADANGLNEIEIEALADTGVDVGALPVDYLVIIGSQAPQAITIGEADAGNTLYDGITAPTPGADILVNLNADPTDNDADVLIQGAVDNINDDLDDITLDLGGGNDFVTGKGGDGTGSPVGAPAPGVGGDDVPIIFIGGPGDDNLEGGLGDDIFIGIDGNDVYNGNANSGIGAGCFQDDVTGVWEAFGFSGGDVLDLSAETQDLTITFLGDKVSVAQFPGALLLSIEVVIAGSGNDTITGDSGDNFLAGGGGNDTIDGMAGDDVIVGDDNGGLDAAGNPTPDGDDNLAGGLGDDCVIGEGGNDILDENKPLNADGTPAYGVFGNGSDALDGGPGLDDVIDYSARLNRTVVYLGIISWFNDGADPNADSISEECDDVFFTTENARTGAGNDLISADFSNNQADNEFTAGAGNDSMDGGAGNDIFHEGTAPNGSDLMDGGGGGDWVDYSGRSGDLNVSLDGSGNDGESGEGDNVGAFVELPGIEGICQEDNEFFPPGGVGSTSADPEPFWTAEAEDQHVPDVENIDGGSGNDVLTGNAAGNTLRGNAGNDQLAGLDGADNLQGGDGNDTLAGGNGNDTLDGGAGTDWVDYQSAGGGGVGVQVNLNTGSSTGEGTDTITGAENVGGSSFADTIRGDAGNNILNGRGGNDTIQGNGGDDIVNGGAGNDTVNGGAGNDTVRGQSGSDAGRGGGGNDRVEGGPGPDTLFGGAGNDRLFGGAGVDHLRGGPGTDRCRVGAPGLGNGERALGCEA